MSEPMQNCQEALPENEKNTVQLKFRNYKPMRKELQCFCVPPPQVDEIDRKLEEELQSILQSSNEQDALLHVNPSKPNWDLKKDLLRKYVKLSKETDRAILQLMRMNAESADIKLKEQNVSSLVDFPESKMMDLQDIEINSN